MTRELSERPGSRTRARVRRALTVALAVAMLALALGAMTGSAVLHQGSQDVRQQHP